MKMLPVPLLVIFLAGCSSADPLIRVNYKIDKKLEIIQKYENLPDIISKQFPKFANPGENYNETDEMSLLPKIRMIFCGISEDKILFAGEYGGFSPRRVLNLYQIKNGSVKLQAFTELPKDCNDLGTAINLINSGKISFLSEQ